jgi:hypothetical protein
VEFDDERAWLWLWQKLNHLHCVSIFWFIFFCCVVVGENCQPYSAGRVIDEIIRVRPDCNI